MTHGAPRSDEPPEVGAPVSTPLQVFRSRPVSAVVIALALSVIPEFVPPLARLRLWSRASGSTSEPEAAPTPEPAIAVGEAELATETEGRSELAPETNPRAQRGPIPGVQPPPLDVQELLDKSPKVPLVDASGRALAGFFSALARTHRKEAGAITRVVHFGDSIVASDYVSGTLRRKFQERFGDAGHGFTLVANAWPAYFHNDIERFATRGWKVSRVTGPYAADGLYGLGCVSFRAEPNTLARFATSKNSEYGGRASRFVVAYLEEPGGGAFEISVDGVKKELVDTNGPAKRSRFHPVEVPDGPHTFELFTRRGASRIFGAILEREGPGVVLDAIGIQGARIRFLDKQDDAHWAEQLQQRAANLLIYQFGANESADGFLYPMTDYHRTMTDVVMQGKRALPEASCLVVGAMDRAAKRGDELISIRVLPHIIEQQRRVAAEVGCAFFDTFQAMGGAGSMATWVRRGLGHPDLTHPSSVGADLIGTWIFRALMQSYGEFVRTASVPPASNTP